LCRTHSSQQVRIKGKGANPLFVQKRSLKQYRVKKITKYVQKKVTKNAKLGKKSAINKPKWVV
jgi:hypothetical protein